MLLDQVGQAKTDRKIHSFWSVFDDVKVFLNGGKIIDVWISKKAKFINTSDPNEEQIGWELDCRSQIAPK